MTPLDQFSSLKGWFYRTGRIVCVGSAMIGLAACSLADPPAADYVLGPMPAAAAVSVSQTGLPVVELKRVQLPDYLDTTDILERRDNMLVPSPTARWGERLSVGMSRALAISLGPGSLAWS